MRSAALGAGFPAIHVLRLTADRPVPTRPNARQAAEEVIQLAVQHPPRIGEARSISQLMAEVLARHGLREGCQPTQESCPPPGLPAMESQPLSLLA